MPLLAEVMLSSDCSRVVGSVIVESSSSILGRRARKIEQAARYEPILSDATPCSRKNRNRDFR